MREDKEKTINKKEEKWNTITNTSHMARWNRVPGRCGDRRRKRERRAISRTEDPPQPSLQGGGEGLARCWR